MFKFYKLKFDFLEENCFFSRGFLPNTNFHWKFSDSQNLPLPRLRRGFFEEIETRPEHCKVSPVVEYTDHYRLVRQDRTASTRSNRLNKGNGFFFFDRRLFRRPTKKRPLNGALNVQLANRPRKSTQVSIDWVRRVLRNVD